MRLITEQEFCAVISDVLCEEFEVFGLHKFYLEVLTNEQDFVGRLVQFPVDASVFNASHYFHHQDGKYEFDRLLEEGVATETHYAYDDLTDAHNHALTLLKDRD